MPHPVQTVEETPLISAKALKDGASMAAQREAVLVRHDFVRLSEEDAEAHPDWVPPLAELASSRGRGGGTALHVYLILLWRCSSRDDQGRYSTRVSARQIAQVLNFSDPNEAGRRRANAAMKVLSEANLIGVEPMRGTTSLVWLNHESGRVGEDGEPKPYWLPRGTPGDRYFKVPAHLYKGTMQQLRGPGLAMLLIVLSTELGQLRKPVWWSVSRWEQQIKLGASTRTKGTKELRELGLLNTRRQAISNEKALTQEPVRTLYTLTTKVHPLPKGKRKKGLEAFLTQQLI